MIATVQVYVLHLNIENWGVGPDNQTIQFDIWAPRRLKLWDLIRNNT